MSGAGDTLAGLRVVARATALGLCILLGGGKAMPAFVDALIYPNGACCCERAHGRAHHCRCVEPHSAEEADVAHGDRTCVAFWDEGGDEYGAPPLLVLPQVLLPRRAVLPLPSGVAIGVRPGSSGLRSRLTERPPVPPPIASAWSAPA